VRSTPDHLVRQLRDRPIDVSIPLRVFLLDYIVLALQGTLMTHLQSQVFTPNIALLVIVLVGFRLGIEAGALHGFLLGWASGALACETTGIPILVAVALGGLAGATRPSFRLDSMGIRVFLALLFLLGGHIAIAVLTYLLWGRFPRMGWIAVLVYPLIAPLADLLVRGLVPED
jgi:cell shape-determining protein MreD